MTGHNSGSFTCLHFNYLNLFFIYRIDMSFYIRFRFVGEWKPWVCQTLCYLCLFCLFWCAWLELSKWLIFLAILWLRNHIFLAGLLIKWMRLWPFFTQFTAWEREKYMWWLIWQQSLLSWLFLVFCTWFWSLDNQNPRLINIHLGGSHGCEAVRDYAWRLVKLLRGEWLCKIFIPV